MREDESHVAFGQRVLFLEGESEGFCLLEEVGVGDTVAVAGVDEKWGF